MVKDNLNRSELPIVDFDAFYNERFTCSCPFCQLLLEIDEWKHATLDFISCESIVDVKIRVTTKHRDQGN